MMHLFLVVHATDRKRIGGYAVQQTLPGLLLNVYVRKEIDQIFKMIISFYVAF